MRCRPIYVFLCGLIGMLFWTPAAMAQHATLRGFIVDQADGQPLTRANVVLQDSLEKILGTTSTVALQ